MGPDAAILFIDGIDDPVGGKGVPSIDRLQGISFRAPPKSMASNLSIKIIVGGMEVPASRVFRAEQPDGCYFGLHWLPHNTEDQTADFVPINQSSNPARLERALNITNIPSDMAWATRLLQVHSRNLGPFTVKFVIKTNSRNLAELLQPIAPDRAAEIRLKLWRDSKDRIQAWGGEAQSKGVRDLPEFEAALFWSGFQNFGRSTLIPSDQDDPIGVGQSQYLCRAINRSFDVYFGRANPRVSEHLLLEQLDQIAEGFGTAKAYALLHLCSPKFLRMPSAALRLAAFNPVTTPEQLVREFRSEVQHH